MIVRYHYRGKKQKHVNEKEFLAAIERCIINVNELKNNNKVLTVALYYYKEQLFLYYEAIATIEPEEVCAPLIKYLMLWPGKEEDRYWAKMYHIYYHSEPQTIEEWQRDRIPLQRRGRIAYLKEDKLFSYIYYHKAIVDEGLLCGDKYQSIALHEDILFSYFEEPKQIVNIRKDKINQSKVIEEWLKVDPESHFQHLPESEGQEEGRNFTFLPSYFAL